VNRIQKPQSIPPPLNTTPTSADSESNHPSSAQGTQARKTERSAGTQECGESNTTEAFSARSQMKSRERFSRKTEQKNQSLCTKQPKKRERENNTQQHKKTRDRFPGALFFSLSGARRRSKTARSNDG
jgi:hypothetical protein